MREDEHRRAADGGTGAPGLPGATPLWDAGPQAGAAAPRDADDVAPETEPGPRPGPPPGAPDAAWSRAFGATNFDSQPFAAAADGEVVYLGGSFASTMAGMPVGTYQRIVRWDGTGWQRMGEGVDGTVYAIAVAGDSVYVGGEFVIAGGRVAANRLARWDGEAWSAVAGGVANSSVPSLGAVRALAFDGTRLYVAGAFDSVGSGPGAIAANGFAALDVEQGRWETYDGGLWFQDGPGEGRAIVLSGGLVYVGGAFDRAGGVETGSFAALDPATGAWTAFGAGLTSGAFIGAVEALAVDDATGTVFVGGSFTAADTVETSGLATLADGRWGTLGAFDSYNGPAAASVKALAVAGGRLYAGGEFISAGNAAASNWAIHDGTEWAQPAEVSNVVTVLAAYGDGVVVGGAFDFSGDLRMPYAGIWTGTAWQTFGQGPSYDPYAQANVFAVHAAGSRLYAGGYFDQAGPVPVGSIAEWTGTRWDAMGGGVRGTGGLGQVYALARLGTDLYVTGDFASAGDGAASHIARWDGERWSALGSGLNDPGYAFAVIGGRLYVGGAFSAAGETPASGVAAWDPATGTWSALGNAPRYDARVMGLAAIADRYLVIGGEFHALRQGNQDLARGFNGMVLFDTQAPVDPARPLSGYFLVAGVQQSSGTGMVRALQVLGGDLYVGGKFDTAGVLQLGDAPDPGFAAQNLAVWHFGTDGSWEAPGGADEPVMAFATLDGRSLVVGGYFGAAGNRAAGGVAELDPATGAWTTYGEGIGPGERGVRHVEALAQAPEDGLWVAGTFNTAGGAPSCSVALWRGTAGRTP